MEASLTSEKSRLEDEKQIQLESLRKKHDAEIEKLKQNLERRHKESQESLKVELSETHTEVSLLTSFCFCFLCQHLLFLR